MPPRRSLALAFVAAVAVARAAVAQTAADVATRRLLLERAEAARRAGRHGEALDAATRAGQLEMTPSVRLFIAEEDEALGRVAEALGASELCLREVESNATARNRDAVRERCTALRSALRPRVGQVVVRVPAPAPGGLRVTVAGEDLNPALFGAPRVVTPGLVALTATAEGGRTWSATVRVDAGASSTVEVALSAPVTTTVAAPVVTAPVITAPVTLVIAPPAAEVPPPAPRNLRRTLAWVSVGGTVAFVAGGVIASVVQGGAGSFLVDASNNCRGDRSALTGTCLAESETEERARAASIAMYAVGGAFAAASVILFVTSSGRSEHRAGVDCRFGLAGATCGLRF